MVKKTSQAPATSLPPIASSSAASSKKKKSAQQKPSTMAAQKMDAPASAPPTRAASPRPTSPAAVATPLAPAPLAPALRRAQSSHYPPSDPAEAVLRYNKWREENEPLMHMWETQALPWLMSTCQRAKLAADDASKRAITALRETLDPQARELAAQLRAHGFRPQQRPHAWWVTHVHQVGVGMPPYLLGALRGLLQEQPVAYEDPFERREKCMLGADDWVFADLQSLD